MRVEIVILVDVDEEPGDTEQDIISYVSDLADEWVRDDIVVSVRKAADQS
jgi:hypothetical protein